MHGYLTPRPVETALCRSLSLSRNPVSYTISFLLAPIQTTLASSMQQASPSSSRHDGHTPSSHHRQPSLPSSHQPSPSTHSRSSSRQQSHISRPPSSSASLHSRRAVSAMSDGEAQDFSNGLLLSSVAGGSVTTSHHAANMAASAVVS